ncbi:PAS domain-containing sensor histidine kinase [Paenibacillus silvisoli]|uniref:PAS domain-containing sensor histidine kinase n=1 Tax=Paenibacillus silvisoli TaxID=3110539 RepID=UPI0028039BB4|nr:PAS domain S-box protein [Paenibacillus silvisoli]
MHNRSQAQKSNSAVTISLVYVIIGSLWVILSDTLIEVLSLSDAITINSSKGIFYVLITALILYFWVKRLKKALTESEERYRVIVVHSPEPIAVISEGEIVYINPAGAGIVGANNPEQVIGQPITNFLHSELIEFIKERTNQADHDATPTDPVEQKLLRIDRQVIDVEVSLGAIMYLGKPAVQLICRDITDRKRAKQLLEEKEQAYRSLVEHNPDAIFSLDLNGFMRNVNSATMKITGYQGEELINQAFIPFLAAPDQEQASILFEKSLQGESNNIEVAIRNKSGDKKDLQLKMVPIYVNQSIEGVFGIAKDISTRKQTEELLIRSEKLSLVGQLAAGVAHEIRNPLTSIRGFVQLLQARNDMNQEFIQIMLSELDRINDIVSEFLVIAKPQAVVFEMQDIRKIIFDVISLLEAQAILYNVQIHTEIADDIPSIRCQQNQLKQVFINILKNAIESMSGEGNVVVQVNVVDNKIVIRFIDNGCGIPEECLTKVGEPFYTTKEKGTGLGLMVCQKIIEVHQGELYIQSLADEGTTVELILPI